MALPTLVASNDSTDSATRCGPFENGGNLYVLSQMYATAFINVFKSTDGGDTWTPIQHDLGPFDGSLGSNSFDADQFGTSIVTVFQDGSTLRVQSFNMASDTWGAASSAGPQSNTGDDSFPDVRVRLVILPSGDLRVFYTEWLTTNQTINYATFSGGVWGSNTILVPSSGTIFNYLGSVFQDSNGLIHLYYRKAATQIDSAALYHASLTTGGSTVVDNLISATLLTFPTGRSFEINGTQNLIYYNSSALTGVWTGNSLGTAPVWSFTLLNILSLGVGVVDIGSQQVQAGSPDYGAKGFGLVSDGVAYVIWQSTSGVGDGYTINRIYMVSNSGSGWSTPNLLYDNFINPAPWIGNPDKIFGITAAVVNGNLYVFTDINCGGLALASISEVTIPLDITCGSPPAGQTGIAYGPHTFPVSGGTPPYTFSISAGALPDGLTLNTVTGVVSGMPTVPGPFSFTVMVTGS